MLIASVVCLTGIMYDANGDDEINGNDDITAVVDNLVWTGIGYGTLTQNTTKSTVTVNEEAPLAELRTTLNNYSLTSTGLFHIIAQRDNLYSFNITGNGTFEAASMKVSGTGAQTITVGGANTTLDVSAGGLEIAKDRHLIFTGGTVLLGSVSVDGTSNATLETKSSSKVTLKGGDASYLTLKTGSSQTTTLSDDLELYQYIAAAASTFDTTNGGLSVGGGGSELLIGATLTVSGANNASLGALKVNAITGLTTSGNANVSADSTTLGAGAFTVNNGGAGTVDLNAVTAATVDNSLVINSGNVLASTLDVDENTTITANAGGTFSVENLSNIASNKTLTLDGSGEIRLKDIVTLEIGSSVNVNNGTGSTSFFEAGISINNPATVNVGAGSTVNIGGAGTVLLGSKLTVDLGSDEGDGTNPTPGTYAKVQGTGNLIVSKTDSTVNEIYGVNGVAGLTYELVFDSTTHNGGGQIADGDVLNTEDAVRTYTLSANGGGYDVVVAGISNAEYDIVKEGGGSGTAAAAGQWFVDNQANMDTAGSDFVTAITNLPTAQQNARAVQEVIGEGTTVYVDQAAMNSIQGGTRAIGQQMTSFRSGNIASGMASSFSSGGATSAVNEMADADELAVAYESGFTSTSDNTVYKKIGVWANGFGGFGEQGTVEESLGYDFWNAGAVIGIDYAVAQELRVGALISYSFSRATRYEDLGYTNDNTIGFGGYGSFNWDNFFVDAHTRMGIHMIDAYRNVFDGTVAKGERTGIDFNVGGTVGYTFNLPADFQLTPSYGLNYTMFYDPDFTEKGAGVSNTEYKSFTSNSLVQDIGLRASKLFRTSDSLAFLPEVWGGWEVEYLNTGGYRNSTTSSSIGAQSYGSVMNGMATHRGYWGLGMTALINDNVSVFGRYDHKIWDKGYNVGFSAGVRVTF